MNTFQFAVVSTEIGTFEFINKGEFMTYIHDNYKRICSIEYFTEEYWILYMGNYTQKYTDSEAPIKCKAYAWELPVLFARN